MKAFFGKFFPGERGFSLVEIMIAAGMLGIISMGVMQMMSNMQRGQKAIAQTSERESLAYEIRLALRDRTGCRRTFAAGFINTGTGSGTSIGVPFNPAPATVTGTGAAPGLTWATPAAGTIYNADGGVVAAPGPGQIYGSGGQGRIEFTSLQIFDEDGTANPNDGLTPGIGVVRLNFTKQGTQGATLGSMTTVEQFRVQFVLNGAGNVVDCFSDEAEYVRATCSALNGGLAGAECHNIRIGDNANIAPMPDVPAAQLPSALTLDGDLLITNAGNTGPGRGVGGAIGVNMAPTRAGSVDILGSLSVGTSSALVGAPNDGGAIFSNYVRVGNAGTITGGATGNVSMGGSLGIGTLTLKTGNGHVNFTGDLSGVGSGYFGQLITGNNGLTVNNVITTLNANSAALATSVQINAANGNRALLINGGGDISFNSNTSQLDFMGGGNNGVTLDVSGANDRFRVQANRLTLIDPDAAFAPTLRIESQSATADPTLSFNNSLTAITLYKALDDDLRISSGDWLQIYETRQGQVGAWSRVVTEDYIRNLIVASVSTTKWELLSENIIEAVYGVSENSFGYAMLEYLCSRFKVNRESPDGALSYMSWDNTNKYCAFTDWYDDIPDFTCPSDQFLYALGSSVTSGTACRKLPSISNAPTQQNIIGNQYHVQMCIELASQPDGDIKCVRKRRFNVEASGSGCCTDSSCCATVGDSLACGAGWTESIGNTKYCATRDNAYPTQRVDTVQGQYHVARLQVLGSSWCWDTNNYINFYWRECVRQATSFFND
ncbi:MAG: type II secretion system protein [Bdellovibrio sp.]|nr:type II secretion system protein [Bdellovibrio sp.]